jgi:hypothetical protein
MQQMRRQSHRIGSDSPRRHILTSLSSFKNAPIIAGTKIIRDGLNAKLACQYATDTNHPLHIYCSTDRLTGSNEDLTGALQRRMWRVKSNVSEDSLGLLPLAQGMKVMVTENVSVSMHVVNGAEGTIRSIKYRTDTDGHRYAVIAYVHIPNCGLKMSGLEADVVPISPVSTWFKYKSPSGQKFGISRKQLPLLPAFAYTDSKSQGRSLSHAIVDLASC